MCSVSTYHTRDRKIKPLKIIGETLCNGSSEVLIWKINFSVPEKTFELYHHDIGFFTDTSSYFLAICKVVHIFPEPELTIT